MAPAFLTVATVAVTFGLWVSLDAGSSSPPTASLAAARTSGVLPGPARDQAALPLDQGPQGEASPAMQPFAEGEFPFSWPVPGRVTTPMNPAHPSGTDIAAAVGDEVRSVRAGRVVFAGGDTCCEYGNYVVIEHDGGWSSLYGHLSAFAVLVDDDVAQGQVIGLAGDTGKARGAHLHFELRSLGAPVDPLAYLLPRRAPPPPVQFVVAPPPAEPPAVPAQVSAPEPEPTSVLIEVGAPLQGEDAIALAAAWLSSEQRIAYDVDAGSCDATTAGWNWQVTCDAWVAGCLGAACLVRLEACVFDQPRLIAPGCP